MESRFKARRKNRFRCKLCHQSLGYCAYRRHKDLPSRYCPGFLRQSVEYHSDTSSKDVGKSRSRSRSRSFTMKVGVGAEIGVGV